jgi:hypothetical protein
LALFNGCLTDLSVDATPNGLMVNYRTIPPRFLFRSVASTAFLSALLFRLNVKDLVVSAAPTAALYFTSGSRFRFRSVPMTASLIAIRPGHRDDVHAGGCVNAAPSLVDHAIALGCFLGIVALAAHSPAFLFGRLERGSNNGSFNTAPTRLAMRSGFLFGSVTSKLSFFGVRLGNPNGFSVYANPAVSRYAIVFLRFFWRAKTPTTSPLAILLSHLNELFACGSLDATPTQLAIRVRFLL